MSKKDNETCTEQLHCRISKKEKKRIKKLADKKGLTVSEYVRTCTLEGIIMSEIPVGEILVKVEEMIRYIEEKYGCDNRLKAEVERVWEICLLK